VKPEIWVSIYAAILATTALALNIKTWFDAGVRLKLSLIPDGVVIGGDPQFDEKDLVIVTVINRGRTVTVISNLLLYEFSSRWGVRRKRPCKSYVIPNPQLKGYPSNIPMELAPSKTWTGAIRRRDDLNINLHDGRHYVAVCTTHRDEPYFKLIPPKPNTRGAQ
jgi:hypothetical protein